MHRDELITTPLGGGSSPRLAYSPHSHRTVSTHHTRRTDRTTCRAERATHVEALWLHGDVVPRMPRPAGATQCRDDNDVGGSP
jgi:hypothetical protein